MGGLAWLTVWLGRIGVAFLLGLVFLYWRAMRNVHTCARLGHVDRLTALLDADPSRVSARDAAGETPLHEATRQGELETIRFLVARSADVEAREKSGATPLHFAAAYGQLSAAKCLLELGAGLDSKDDTGLTPFMVAVGAGHEDVATALKHAGADTTAPPALLRLGSDHFSSPLAPDDPLMLAAAKRRPEAS